MLYYSAYDFTVTLYRKIRKYQRFIKQLTANEKDNLDNFQKKMKIKLKLEFFKKRVISA